MKTFLKIFFVALIAVAPVSVFAASYPYTVSYNGTSITLTSDTTLTCTGNAPSDGLYLTGITWNGAGVTCDGSTQHANGGNLGWGNAAIGSYLVANFGVQENTLHTIYGDSDFLYYVDSSGSVVFVPANFSFAPPAPTTPAAVENISLATSTAPSLVGILNGFLDDPGFYAVLLLVIGVPFAFWLMKFLLELFYENNRENERMAKKAAARAAIREEKKDKEFRDVLSGNKGRREKEAAKFKYLSKMNDKDVDFASKQFNKKK